MVLRRNSKPNCNTCPDAHLPDNQFAAILCSRVFHFLTGDEIDASLANMYRWLKPGGRLYLVADTPYGIWRNFIPVWDANHEQGVRWPGYMSPLLEFLPYKPSGDHVGPPFMNFNESGTAYSRLRRSRLYHDACRLDCAQRFHRQRPDGWSRKLRHYCRKAGIEFSGTLSGDNCD